MADDDDNKFMDIDDPWKKVFELADPSGKINNVNDKIKQLNDWGLEIMDMLQADKQDVDALCEALNLDGAPAKKFKTSVRKCVVLFSQWAFLKETLDDEKQAQQLITKLNIIEKPASMITDGDIKSYCDDCKINFNDVHNVIGWYKTLQPLINQTKGTITQPKVTAYIKKLYTTFDLPFFAMEEADTEDLDGLASDLGLTPEVTKHFKANVASQLKLQGLMSALKD